MKSPVFLTVPLAMLLAACSTPKPPQKAAQGTPYHKPLTSPGALFGALPPVVQLTVLAQVGPEPVVDAVRDTSSGQVVYKVYLKDADLFPPLYVAPDGSVLNRDLSVAVNARPGARVKLADLPEAVQKAIPKHAPAGEVSYIIKEHWGGRTVYFVTFKDQTHTPRLLLGEDGSLVSETE